MYDPLMEKSTVTVAFKAFFRNPFIFFSALTANIKHKYRGTSTKNKCGAVTLKTQRLSCRSVNAAWNNVRMKQYTYIYSHMVILKGLMS